MRSASTAPRRRAVLAGALCSGALLVGVGGAWGVAPPAYPFPPVAPSTGVRVDTAVLEYAVDPYAEVLSSPVGARVLQVARAEGARGDIDAMVRRLERDRSFYERVLAQLTTAEQAQVPQLSRRIQVARQFEAAFMPPIRLNLSEAGGWVVVTPGPATLALFGGSYGYIDFEHRRLTTIGSVLGQVVSDTQEDITLTDVFRVPEVIRSRLEVALRQGSPRPVLRSDWNALASGVVSVETPVPTGTKDKAGLAWLHDLVAGEASALRRDTRGAASLRANYYYSRDLMGELPTAVQQLLLAPNTGFLVGFELEDEAGRRITYRLRQRTRERLDRGVFEAPTGYPKAGEATKALRGLMTR